jgi:hypothetical protein
MNGMEWKGELIGRAAGLTNHDALEIAAISDQTNPYDTCLLLEPVSTSPRGSPGFLRCLFLADQGFPGYFRLNLHDRPGRRMVEVVLLLGRSI